MTAVTASTPSGPVGLAIGSFASVSLDPPLVGFFVASTSWGWSRTREAGRFCVNVLAADQEEVCRVFASRATDKFAGVGWEPSGGGSPRLEGALAWIDCTMEAVHATGDHDVCIGPVQALGAARERGRRPLVFLRGGYGRFES